MPGEDRAAFELLLRGYEDEWNPRSPHETFLVTQMVQARWRLNRIARMEAEIYDAIFTMPFAEGKSDEAAIVIAQPIMNEAMLDKLHRYAKDAERAYNRATKELRSYRAEQAKQHKTQQTQPLSPAGPEIRNEPKLRTSAVPSPPQCQPLHSGFSGGSAIAAQQCYDFRRLAISPEREVENELGR